MSGESHWYADTRTDGSSSPKERSLSNIIEDSTFSSVAQSSEQPAATSSGAPLGASSERSSSDKRVIPYLRRSGHPVYVFLDADGQIAKDHRDRFADLKDILQRNMEKCRKLYDCLADISYELRICGTDQSSASPAILITCPANKAKHLRMVIAQPHVQDQCKPGRNFLTKQYPELQIIILAESIHRKSFGLQDIDDMDVGVAPFPPQTLCGLQIIFQGLEHRKSTVACLISVQSRRFALTTAHTLLQPGMLPIPVGDDNIESKSHEETDLHADEDLYEFPDDETLESIAEEPRARWAEIIAEGHAIYKAPTDKKWTNSHPNLDWLLLELKNPSQWLPNIWLAPGLGNPIPLSSISVNAPSQDREVLIISSKGPAMQGILRPIPSYIGDSLSPLTSEVWTVKLVNDNDVIRSGDSGSLVIDASDHQMYGQVIATSPLEDVYVVPLKDILPQIEEVLQEGNVSLQATNAIPEDDPTSSAGLQPSLNIKQINTSAASDLPSQNAGQTTEAPNNDSTWIVSELQCLVHSMREALELQDLQKVNGILKTLGQQQIVTDLQSLVDSTEEAHKRQELQKLSDARKDEPRHADITQTVTGIHSQVLPMAQGHDSERLLNLAQNQSPVLSVPIAENRDFTGRHKELEQLREKLIVNHSSPGIVSCALNGIAGIGKTQTALKFLYTHLKDFDAIFWVSADPEQKSEIDRTFCNIGLKLKLFKGDKTDEAQIEAVYTWLQTTGKRWLLVLDNVKGYKNIERYWPQTSRAPSAIISTSRSRTPWATHTIDVEALDDIDGRNFFLRQMNIKVESASSQQLDLAERISKLLGGCPLYLTYALGFMNLTGCSLQQYDEFLQTSSSVLGYKVPSTWRYGSLILATHDKMLEELSASPKTLLFMLTFMSADDVREDLLLRPNDSPSLMFLADKPAYYTYLAELEKVGLVQRQHENGDFYLRIHRATQDAMHLQLQKDTDERSASFNRVTQLLRANYPSPSKLQIAEASNWPNLAKVLPHVLSMLHAFDKSSPSIVGNIELARLFSDIGCMDLVDRGKISEAYRLNKKVLEILDTLDASHEKPLRSDALVIIGNCTDFMALNKREEGLQTRLECVAIREQCYREIPRDAVTMDDRIRLHNSYTDLACSYQQTNDFENVRKYAEQCFEQYKRWGAEDEYPYEYAKYYNHMAYVLLYENNKQSAIEYAKRGYELVEKASPDTGMAVIYQFDYANIVFQVGHRQESLLILKQLLESSERDHGRNGVRTLDIRLNIGIVSYMMGDLSYAENQIREAIASNKGNSWPVENIVRAEYYLSQVLKLARPQEDEWGKLERQAFKEVESLLKHDHLHMAALSDNPPMVFDYLVPWECRLVTPRKGQSLTWQSSLS